MKDPAEIIKNVSAVVLVGILYNGNPVAIYDDTADNNATFPRIILQDVILGSQTGNRIAWRMQVTQVIKVTNRYGIDVDSNVVNEISSQILELLVPSTREPYMNIGPDFRIILSQLSSASNQRYGDPFTTHRYVDRNLRIQYLIEQTQNA